MQFYTLGFFVCLMFVVTSPDAVIAQNDQEQKVVQQVPKAEKSKKRRKREQLFAEPGTPVDLPAKGNEVPYKESKERPLPPIVPEPIKVTSKNCAEYI